MAAFDIEVVGKIGSMALIQREEHDIDYNIFAKIGRELRPGYIWISSGASEIGRLDYMRRHGHELDDGSDAVKADYAAQGQSILMENYRRYIDPKYSVRQLLVEHIHFNDEEKRENIKGILLRAAAQGAIPIINYNDPVSVQEITKMELRSLKETHDQVVECVDNDETAAVICNLVKARVLLLLTSVEGIYRNASDPSTLIREIGGASIPEVLENICEAQKNCNGSSRPWSNGAYTKLEYIKEPVKNGTKVIIGHSRYGLNKLLRGEVPCTVVGVR